MENLFPLISINRHRIFQDGDGVFTLVAGAHCPLACRYCINKDALASGKIKYVTPQELFDEVKIDNLYFLATNGGVTFGGGEPLLYPDFIRAFAKIVDKTWHINIETSLHVPAENLSKLFGLIDKYYVDIKDCNHEIYKEYTGKENNCVMENLKLLYASEGKDKVVIRIPLIKGFNTEEDVLRSKEAMEQIGFDTFDCFTYLLPEEQEKLKHK